MTKTASKGGDTRVRGADLVPRFDDASPGMRRAVLTRYAYWVGLVPSCPVEAATIAGICFPKACELVGKDANNDTTRTWVFGSIVRLTRQQFLDLRERMPRTVVRSYPSDEAAAAKDGPTSGIGLGETRRPRRGKLVTIPSEAEIAERLKHGRAVNYYDRSPHDKPLADYAYAVLCPDQTNPSRSGGGLNQFPTPLAESEFVWPESIDEVDELKG